MSSPRWFSLGWSSKWLPLVETLYCHLLIEYGWTYRYRWTENTACQPCRNWRNIEYKCLYIYFMIEIHWVPYICKNKKHKLAFLWKGLGPKRMNVYFSMGIWDLLFVLPYMTITKAFQCRFVVYQLTQVLCPKGLCRPLEHWWRHICWCFWISYQGNMRNLLFWNAKNIILCR